MKKPQSPQKVGFAGSMRRAAVEGRKMGRRRRRFALLRARLEVVMPMSAAMPGGKRRFVRWARRTLAGSFALALAGCNAGGLGLPNPAADSASAPVPQVQSAPLGAPTVGAPTVGETLGNGPVRVGLILPLTQNGGPSVAGASLRNAAQLAIEESGMSDITLMIQDDRGTPDGAAQAAQAEVAAGAEIILGPLLAPDVREVGRVAKAA